ncbi:Protein trichome birefringence [Rhynchospora pubera]|uniref:Protein trichome birefringence n=1 Tax=Rhynchospora pubera TaxID=906938 RepID=A0AAV8FGJ3_9POAL|nr:Protein trichome birefringence [Rhynchospora pubera]
MFIAKEALSKSVLRADHLKVDLMPRKVYDETVNSIPGNSSVRVPFQVPHKNSSLTIELCDVSKGSWVRETGEPIYSNLTCSFIPENKNCQKYGKPPHYLYWRWKPDGCDLPRFEPEKFLDLVRGKKLAFVGDSLARNQFDSLLCLLSQAEMPITVELNPFKKIYKMHFPSSNFTLMVMWSEFYVQGIPVVINGTTSSSFDIHLGKINTNWTSQLPSLDYLVISGGNWFFRKMYLHKNGKLIGCVNCREDEYLKDYGMEFTIRSVVRKALESINSCQNCDGLVTFLRTYTTSHFENESWFNGGDCNRTEPMDEEEINLYGMEWDIRKIQKEEIERIRRFNGVGESNKKFYEVLDVTKAMKIRADAHPGAYYNKNMYRHANDCLHWCLPGPVDMWNEMLMLNLINTSSYDLI